MAKCGCGRSNTGECIGWHKLTEEEYKRKLSELNESQKTDEIEGVPV